MNPIQARYFALFLQYSKAEVLIPPCPFGTNKQEAFEAGFRLGRMKGYEDGLVEGTDLGFEVFQDTANMEILVNSNFNLAHC